MKISGTGNRSKNTCKELKKKPTMTTELQPNENSHNIKSSDILFLYFISFISFPNKEGEQALGLFENRVNEKK